MELGPSHQVGSGQKTLTLFVCGLKCNPTRMRLRTDYVPGWFGRTQWCPSVPGHTTLFRRDFFITSQLVFGKWRSSVIVPRRTILRCNVEAFRQKCQILRSFSLFPSQSRLMITSYKLILTGRPRQASNRY